MASLLEQLRGLSAVDLDSLDVEVAKSLGPFVDHTSNQAIAFFELSKIDSSGEPLYKKLIAESIQTAHWMFSKQSDATLEELAVELMMVGLSIPFAPYLTGNFLIQTNPKWSYSTEKTIKNAQRIVSHYTHLSPSFDTKRVCIKVPSTWEGLQACRELEKKGITTLATTMFCMEQAVLAADAGCTYIAPYVNELKVHFEPGYVDPAKAFPFCGAAQVYYEQRKIKTLVMPASLTSVAEVMQLAGAHHLTVSPPLLAELAATPAETWADRAMVGQTLRAAATTATPAADQALYDTIVKDESLWRLAFTRSAEGRNEGKIIQAINIFSNMQDALEEMVRKVDAAAK